MPGRPPTKRIRMDRGVGRKRQVHNTQESSQASGIQQNDMPSGSDKLTKRGSSSKCSIYQKEGHNRSTCPDRTNPTLPRLRKKNGTQTTASTQESHASKRPRGGRAFYKAMNDYGFGVRVNLETGHAVIDLGMPSQRVIQEGTA